MLVKDIYGEGRRSVTRPCLKPMIFRMSFLPRGSTSSYFTIGRKVISPLFCMPLDTMSSEPANKKFKITDIDEETLNSGAEG